MGVFVGFEQYYVYVYIKYIIGAHLSLFENFMPRYQTLLFCARCICFPYLTHFFTKKSALIIIQRKGSNIKHLIAATRKSAI